MVVNKHNVMSFQTNPTSLLKVQSLFSDCRMFVYIIRMVVREGEP